MGKEKLNQKVTALDPLFLAEFNPMDPLTRASPYANNGYQKLSNFGIQRDTIAPVGVTTPLPGQTVRFQISKRQTKLGCVWLKFTVSALTPVGGGSAALVDYAGFRFIEDLEMRYMSNLIQKLDWRRLHCRHMLKHGPNEFDAEAERAGGNLNFAEREGRGADVQTFEVKLPLWFTLIPGYYLTTDSLSHSIELSVRLASAGDVTQATSGQAPTFTINSIELQAELHHTENAERNYWIDRTMSDPGMMYSFRDWQSQNNNVLTAGQTSYAIDLSQITSSVTNLMFTVKPFAAVNSPASLDNEPFLFKRIKRAQLRSNNTVIYDWTSESQMRTVDCIRHYIGPCGLYYGWSAAMDPMDEINATGHDSFAGFSSPTLYIEFDSDPGQCVVDVLCQVHNLVQQKSADMQTVFHV